MISIFLKKSQNHENLTNYLTKNYIVNFYTLKFFIEYAIKKGLSS